VSLHIGASKEDIAETVLLPGDPLRAKFIAENILKNAVCYNEIRGMYGFTGIYKGKRVSVQGTGMGIPSHLIYVTELIKEYNVKKLIRIGTCGSIQSDIKIRDIILAMSASTDSSFNTYTFGGRIYAPTANFELLQKAYKITLKLDKNPKVGNILSSDIFYDEPDFLKIWAKYGVLAVEMETAALYTLAAEFGVKALTILTVSDNLITDEHISVEERQKKFNEMIKIALELV